MLTILSTALSFLMGGLPKILDFFQDRSDKQQELALAKMQTERELALAKEGFLAQQKVEEIRTEQVYSQSQATTIAAALDHDKSLSEGTSPWVKNLRASVRPIVTYIFVLELVLVNFVAMWWAIKTGVDFTVALDLVFSDQEMQIVASIVSFWFGTQAFSKK